MYKKRGLLLPIRYFFDNHLFDLHYGTDTHTWLLKKHYSSNPKNLANKLYTLVIRLSTVLIKKKSLIIILLLRQMELIHLD